jgi:PST family polysaccharide transporter
LQYFSRNIDKLLIGWRYNAQSVGYYKKAYDLFALPASQLIVPIHNVALATLSRLTNEPDNYRGYYLSAISIIAFVAMPLSAMMTLAGKDIILFILGPQWIKAGEIFCYFGVSIGIMLIYATQSWLHLSLGRPDRWLRWCIFECIATTAFFAVGLLWGAKGVAIGYAVSFYVLAAPCLLYAGKPINLKLNSIISTIWKYFTSSALAGVLSFFILYKIPYLYAFFYKQHVFLKIMIASILCGTLYLLLIILFYQSVSPIKNFLSTARQMIPSRKL